MGWQNYWWSLMMLRLFRVRRSDFRTVMEIALTIPDKWAATRQKNSSEAWGQWADFFTKTRTKGLGPSTWTEVVEIFQRGSCETEARALAIPSATRGWVDQVRALGPETLNSFLRWFGLDEVRTVQKEMRRTSLIGIRSSGWCFSRRAWRVQPEAGGGGCLWCWPTSQWMSFSSALCFLAFSGKKGEACCSGKGGRLILWRLDKCRRFVYSVIPQLIVVYMRGRSQRDFLSWICKERAWCPAESFFSRQVSFPRPV